MVQPITIPTVGKDFKSLIILYVSVLVLCGPAGIFYVYGLGGDRANAAYGSFWAFDFAMYGLLFTPWLPLASLKNFSNYERLSLMVQAWVITYAMIALTFEIPWLLLHEQMAAAPEALWTFFWMMYVEGGDTRYADPSLEILYAEFLACANAAIASVAIYKWFKSGRSNVNAVLLLMFCACMHIPPTIFYYTNEIVSGFPHVDTEVVSNWLAKFIISNSCWLWMPFVVLYWGKETLHRLYTGQAN